MDVTSDGMLRVDVSGAIASRMGDSAGLHDVSEGMWRVQERVCVCSKICNEGTFNVRSRISQSQTSNGQDPGPKAEANDLASENKQVVPKKKKKKNSDTEVPSRHG